MVLADRETVLVFGKPDAQTVRNIRSPHFVVAFDTADQGGDVVILRLLRS